ncbi:hypothetical protein [Mycobacteroides abscessus]|uniref:hypothetical protein n=1 Tax=Mycobacteroides abscessus TaxID=36809 RepID=UPI0018967069
MTRGSARANTPGAVANNTSFRDAARSVDTEHWVDLPTGVELSEGWLTQFGTDWFREEPRFEQEFDVSVLLGNLTLKQTVYAMLGRKPKEHHCKRHFRVERLTAARYRCLHSAHPNNPQHASILAGCSDEDIEAHIAWWSDPRREKLESLVGSGV